MRLTFDSTSLNQKGTHIFPSNDNFGTPERDITEIEVPGRNGVLTIDNGRYDNRDLKYTFILQEDIRYYDWFRNVLLKPTSYRRLEDSTQPGIYVMARCTEVTPVASYRDAWTFDASFTAKPEKWYKIGEKALTFTASGTIQNRYKHDAIPMVRVYGYGQIKIGSGTIDVAKNSNSYVDIDSETGNAYCGDVNCNSYISVTDWFKLVVGSNTVTIPSTVSKVEITPRWWEI